MLFICMRRQGGRDKIVFSFSLGGRRQQEKHPAPAAATVTRQWQSRGYVWQLAQRSRSLHSRALPRSGHRIKGLSHPQPRKSAKGSKTSLSVSKHIWLALQGNSAGTALCKISIFSSEFSLQNVEKMCNFFTHRVLRKLYWLIYLLVALGYKKIICQKKGGWAYLMKESICFG